MHSVIRRVNWDAARVLKPVRTGFTLIELTVTIGVISMLVSLILPAVQRTREAARQTQCRNNLKQLAAAVFTFEESERKLPPSDLGDGWPTWATLILPKIEQGQLYHGWDLKLSYYSQSSQCGVQPAVYLCPSRPEPSRNKGDIKVFLRDGIRIGPTGWSHYAGVAGTSTWAEDGAFVRALDTRTSLPVAVALTSPSVQFTTSKNRLGMRDFTDGQSTTLLFGEKHLPSNDPDPSVFNGDDTRSYLRSCGPALSLVADPNYTAVGGKLCFGSAHPGMCLFAFVDGSVRPINVSIDRYVLGGLATRAGGEVVSHADY